jgi:DNA helicase-2/ATP-dependent DNA helicase PcrA
MARTYTLKRSAHAAAAAPAIRIDYKSELNPQQYEAVTAPPGPALVIAGAGSGKTRTLIYRVAYLLENGVEPANILLLTFTNKAAREMLERVANLLPDSATDGLWGGTFHSIGNKILRRHAEAIGFRRGFSIMDREDQEDLVKTAVAAAGVDPKDKRFPKGEVLADIFSFAINTGRSVKTVVEERYPYFLDLIEGIEKVRDRYEAKKRATNSLDFDDLLEKTLRLLREHAEIAEIYQRQFQFLLVDEYQDTNKIQADFVDILAARQQNITVVGDDAQSIYSWRGANFQNILQFPQRYPQAKVYKIETNYRSVPEILEVANASIAENVQQFSKNLHAVRDARTTKPALIELNDGNQQALFVTQRILELRDEGVELNEIAVLYRAHFHSMELQLELTRHGVPFQITSGLRFFEQAHIKDVAAFLKLSANHHDEVAFKRIARLLPGVGGVAADKLWAHFEKKLGDRATVDSFGEAFAGAKVPPKSERAWKQLVATLDEITPEGIAIAPAAAIDSVIEGVYDDYAKVKFPNYENRREDLNVLAGYARQYGETDEFLSQLALVTSLETEDVVRGRGDDDEQVTLSSVHQAKGLEWKVVFVINLTEGAFPSHRSVESPEAIEEERRLFYVAVTRACDELYLTFPFMKLTGGYGGDMFQRPSRFLQEVPTELVEKWEIERGF